MRLKEFSQNELSSLSFKNILLLILTLVLLCFVFYGNTLKNNYNLDDHFVYTENLKAINGLADFEGIFKRNSFEGSTYDFGYRPITILSFALENELFGLNPFVSHFINVLLYGVVCSLFLLLLRATFPKQSVLWLLLCSLFFLIMPIHSEMVNNVKSRDEILMLVFGLFATLSFLKASTKNSTPIWLLVGIASLLLSILAKKSGVVFIGISAVGLYFKGGIPLKKGLLIGTLPLASWIGYLLMKRLIKEGKSSGNIRSNSFIENPLYNDEIEVSPLKLGLECLEFYFQKLSLPFELVSYYGYNTIPYQGFDYSNILTLIIALCLFALALWGLKRRHPLSFGIILFFGGILPFLNLLFPMVGIVADRFAGLASIGAAIFWPSLVLWANNKVFKINSNSLPIALFGLYVIYSFTLVKERNKEWETEEILLKADVLKEPKSATLHALIGKEYLYQIPNEKSVVKRNNLTLKAEQHLKTSLQIAKDKVIHAELGNLYFRAKLDFKSAEKQYQLALNIDSLYSEPYYHMGWLELERGRTEKALANFKKTIKLKADYAEAYEPAVRILSEKGRFQEALDLNSKGKQLLPNNPRLILNEANIYDLMGNKKRAKEIYKIYLEKVPNDIAVRNKYRSIP